MTDSLDRMVMEDAHAMAELRSARTRARTDHRRLAVLGVLLVGLIGGYGAGYWQGVTPCDPSSDGCRFTDGAQVLQTVGDVTWPVCPNEYAAGPCVWDAQRDGNGHGSSFTVVDNVVTHLS